MNVGITPFRLWKIGQSTGLAEDFSLVNFLAFPVNASLDASFARCNNFLRRNKAQYAIRPNKGIRLPRLGLARRGRRKA